MQSSLVRSTTIKMQNCCVCSKDIQGELGFSFVLFCSVAGFFEVISRWSWIIFVFEPRCNFWCFPPFIPGDERDKQCLHNCECGCANDGFGSAQSIPSWARNWILTMCVKGETIEHSIWAKPKNISTHRRFAQRGSEILFYVWKSQIKRTGNWTFSETGKKAKFNAPSPRFVLVTAAGRRPHSENQLQVDSNRHALLKSQPYQPITHKLPLFCKTTISWHQVFLKRWPTQWFPLISLFCPIVAAFIAIFSLPPSCPTSNWQNRLFLFLV